jgi:hypothetical protein
MSVHSSELQSEHHIFCKGFNLLENPPFMQFLYSLKIAFARLPAAKVIASTRLPTPDQVITFNNLHWRCYIIYIKRDMHTRVEKDDKEILDGTPGVPMQEAKTVRPLD